jgi:uncharacterized 2Fe-2S/4Fe-4S cluster protein (DUF4445 family)
MADRLLPQTIRRFWRRWSVQGLFCALIVAAKVVAARGYYGLAVDLGTTTIAVYPYEPQFVEEKRFLSESIGLRFNPKAEVRTLPLIKRKLSYSVIQNETAKNKKPAGAFGSYINAQDALTISLILLGATVTSPRYSSMVER